ncbi:MAG: hypothetical protein V4496_00330 [Pseudomonadota bacterium]
MRHNITTKTATIYTAISLCQGVMGALMLEAMLLPAEMIGYSLSKRSIPLPKAITILAVGVSVSGFLLGLFLPKPKIVWQFNPGEDETTDSVQISSTITKTISNPQWHLTDAEPAHSNSVTCSQTLSSLWYLTLIMLTPSLVGVGILEQRLIDGKDYAELFIEMLTGGMILSTAAIAFVFVPPLLKKTCCFYKPADTDPLAEALIDPTRNDDRLSA